MKITILILLAICSSAFAQLQLPAPFNKPLSLYTKTGILQALGNPADSSSRFLRIDGSWQTVSGGSGIPAFPNDSTLFLRGDSTWSAVSGGSPYFKDDGGTPVRAPSVTAGTKGIAIGDSASATAYGAQVYGRQSTASALDATTIGNTGVASGKFSFAVANSNFGGQAGSLGTISIFGFDLSTSQVNDGAHGNNILIGGNSSTGAATDAMNIAIGYNSGVKGSGNSLFGANTYANGSAASYETFLGYGVGNFVPADGKYQTILGATGSIAVSEVTGLPHLNHDSTTVIGNSYGLYSRNAHNVLIGWNNDTSAGGTFSNGTKHLFDVGNGNLWGNPSRSNALTVLNNGTVIAGKNFVAGASLGSSTTPTAGTYAKDNAIIAWGDVSADSTFNGLQYGNFTITHPATGQYVITLPTVPTHAICVVTLTGSTLGLSAASSITGAVITIATGVGAVATDESFNFIVTGR